MLIHHTVTGSGPAVLLLHAGVCDSRMWQPQVAALAPDHTVVTVDLRGYGESPLPAGPYSEVAGVLAVLDHRGIGDVAVVGASYGGAVALRLACAAPRRVRRLVLLCAPADGVEQTPDVRTFGQREDELLEAGDVEAATDLNVATWVGPEADDVTRRQVWQMQERAFRIQLAAGDDAGPDDAEADPAGIAAATLVVAGARDLDYFRHSARHLAAAIPGARYRELGWAGHLPSLERPDETTALIRDAI